MKKSRSVFFAALLVLALAACGDKAPQAFDPASDARTLLDKPGVFSSPLVEIDQATACALYGIDEGGVTGSAVYMANAVSAEELAVFAFSDGDAAQAAATALSCRVEDRKEALADYLPGEVPKLDGAVVEVRGNSALLVVAADYAGVEEFLGS